MTYIDLGRYTATTGPDATGQNTGNLTSVISLSPISVPYFEMYRCLIDTSAFPNTSAIPTVRQTTSAAASSLTTLNMTFPSATVIGNTIVTTTMSDATGTVPTQSAATIGGIADHFANIPGASSANGTHNVSTWVCPATTQASTALVLTYSGGSGTGAVAGYAYEVSGCLNTTTATAAVDVAAATFNASATNLTTTPVNTAANSEMFIGFMSEWNGSAYPTLSTSTTTPTLTALSQLNTGSFHANLGHYGAASTAGTPIAYNARSTIAGNFDAVALTLFGATGASSPALPFQFTVDGRTWDRQQTVAGVGYTYNTTQPLPLVEGNTLYLFWTSLPSASFSAYSALISIQAWFRYDPSIQRR